MRCWTGFARRLGVLLLVGFLGELLVRMAPGFGFDERQLDPRLSAVSQERIRQEAAVGHNVLSFYWRYVRNAFHGDLGYSRLLDRPVSELLRERLPVTSAAVGAGWLAGWTVGFALALVGTLRQGFGAKRRDSLTLCSTAVSGALLCLPAAVIGLVLFFSGLPVAVGIVVVVFPKVYLYTQSVLREGLELPHVLTAGAKGLGPLRVLLIHVVPPARRTFLALLGITITTALGASVPLEVVCDSPGIGQLAWKAAIGRDLPLLTALTLLVAAVTLAANSLTDAAAQQLEGAAP